jgi:hypothetical protein
MVKWNLFSQTRWLGYMMITENYVMKQRAKKLPVNFCGFKDIMRPLAYVLNIFKADFYADFCGLSLTSQRRIKVNFQCTKSDWK